jgi:hypothetical protein
MEIVGNRWYHKLCRFIERNGGKRSIYRNEDGDAVLYLDRFYIIKTPWIEVMIHRFYLGDRGPLHDRPAFTFGWILQTGYYERLCKYIDANGVTQGEYDADRKEGDFGYRPASNKRHDNYRAFHKVKLRSNSDSGNVYTLFVFCKRNAFSWGFRGNDGNFIPFENFNKQEGVESMQTDHSKYKGWFFPRKVA